MKKIFLMMVMAMGMLTNSKADVIVTVYGSGGVVNTGDKNVLCPIKEKNVCNTIVIKDKAIPKKEGAIENIPAYLVVNGEEQPIIILSAFYDKDVKTLGNVTFKYLKR